MSDPDTPGPDREPGSPAENHATAQVAVPEPAEAVAKKPAAARRARGAIIVGARVVAGAVGMAAAAATVLAAAFLPLPTYQVSAPEVEVVPVATGQQRACPGPFLRLGEETGEGATIASAIGVPRVHSSASDGMVQNSNIGATEESTGRAPTVLTLPPQADSASDVALLAGGQSQTASAGDVAGFAAGECSEPRKETWLVGGSTATGRTTLLTLTNPGAVASTVDLSIFGADGEIEAPGTDGILVPADSQTIVSLAGLAPGVASPVVRVVSSGGLVVANLQQTTVRTLDPGGIDIVGGTQPPSRNTVIPGLMLSSHEAIEAAVAQPGMEDLQPVVRFFVPGDRGATAKITLASSTVDLDTRTVEFELLAGRVTELPLDHFEDGSYTISIESDVPLVAAARVSTIGAAGTTDFAWVSAAPVVRNEALVAVPEGPAAAIHLANPTETDADVTVRGESAPITVTVPAGGVAAVPVPAGEAYTVSGFERLQVAVGFLGDGAVSAFTVTPTGPAASPILVYP